MIYRVIIHLQPNGCERLRNTRMQEPQIQPHLGIIIEKFGFDKIELQVPLHIKVPKIHSKHNK